MGAGQSGKGRDPFDFSDQAFGDIPGSPAGGDGPSSEGVREARAGAHGRIAFTILGEPASKANSRELVIFGKKPPWKETLEWVSKNAGTEPALILDRVKRVMAMKDESRAASIKSDKARAYEKAAVLAIPHWARVMFTGPVRVTATIYYASERPDLDESVVLDVMQAVYERRGEERVLVRKGVYLNDRQVREKHIYHRIDRANPRAELIVEALAPQQGVLA